MKFSGVIKELEQGQQKQTQIIDLQCDDMLLKKMIKDRGKLLLREGDLGLNEVTKRMKQNQKKQPTQIIDSYSETISLETSLKELETKTVQQWHFEETVNKLKKDIEDLREGKDKVTKEKNEAKSWLVVMQEALSNATKHLEEVGTEKKALLQQVEEFKSAYCLLQKKHEAELKTKSKRQYLERDHTICRKEKKIRELQHLKQKLEHEADTVTSVLHGLREEKENTEKGLLSLQTTFQGGKDASLAERQQLGSKYNKLAAQLKILQVEFENEQAEREKMQQQICEFRIENQKLQQQSAKDQERNRILQLENARWKKKYDKVRESQTAKDTDHLSVIEHNRKNEAIVQLQEEVKNLTLKKKTLEKKESGAGYQKHGNGIKLSDLHRPELDKYHKQNNELQSQVKRLHLTETNKQKP
nr:PREDICTED: cancer-associated gene 1 protein isoform X2 [Apteryx mantelli mantelli]